MLINLINIVTPKGMLVKFTNIAGLDLTVPTVGTVEKYSQRIDLTVSTVNTVGSIFMGCFSEISSESTPFVAFATIL